MLLPYVFILDGLCVKRVMVFDPMGNGMKLHRLFRYAQRSFDHARIDTRVNFLEYIKTEQTIRSAERLISQHVERSDDGKVGRGAQTFSD